MKAFRRIPDRNRPLLAWQRPTLARMLTQENPALFLDMRLGKSLLTVEYCVRRNLRRVLVVCPKTAIVSWLTELEKEHLPTFVSVKPSEKRSACGSTEKGWYLTTFAALQNTPFNVAVWDAIVIDESSKMKNPKALITKKLLRYYSTIPHRILLSGTPTPETPTEAVTQLIFKDGTCLGCKDYWTFRRRYMHLAGFDWALNHGVYDRLKEELHRTCIFLSQKGAGWDTTEHREQIHFQLSPRQKELVEKLLENFEMEIDGKKYTTKYILPQTIWMSRVVSGLVDGVVINGAKYDWLVDYVTTEQHIRQQFIVWFRFNDQILHAQTVLQANGIHSEILLGKVKLAERVAMQRRFQSGEVRVLLIQTKLGQYSLNLSKAAEAIYFSNSFSAEERTQSEKRICHTDRTTPPSYKDLVFADSIDEDILEQLKTKHFSFRVLWSRMLRRRKM